MTSADDRLVTWCALLDEVFERRDFDAVPGVLALMAMDGYAIEAETLRTKLLALIEEIR